MMDVSEQTRSFSFQDDQSTIETRIPRVFPRLAPVDGWIFTRALHRLRVSRAWYQLLVFLPPDCLISRDWYYCSCNML